MAAAGAGELSLFDIREAAAETLSQRLLEHYPALRVRTGSNDPAGHDIVVNATPLGMEPGDPLPLDVTRLSPSTYVGEVVMRQDMSAFLQAARDRGCRYQVGTDMLFEQIPAYLEFFGLPGTSAEELRRLARLEEGARIHPSPAVRQDDSVPPHQRSVA
jgi:shikimate dehydrogenase